MTLKFIGRRRIPKNKLPSDLEELKRVCVVSGYLTGSERFGTASPDSDIDYIVRYESIATIVSLETLSYCYKRGHPFPGFYIYGAPRTLNVIVTFKERDYEKWVLATDLMAEMCSAPILGEVFSDKGTRVRGFESIRKVLGI